MSVHKKLTEEDKIQIKNAIQMAELDTSGEIRVHIEEKCREEVLDRAAYLFKKLKMHKTKLRNGVLFYLAIDDRKFAILGDAGIHSRVPDTFWDEIKKTCFAYFSENKIAEGLSRGIRMAGQQLKEHFPHQSDDINELDDEISVG
jgi:uncharacterized membrane protein